MKIVARNDISAALSKIFSTKLKNTESEDSLGKAIFWREWLLQSHNDWEYPEILIQLRTKLPWNWIANSKALQQQGPVRFNRDYESSNQSFHANRFFTHRTRQRERLTTEIAKEWRKANFRSLPSDEIKAEEHRSKRIYNSKWPRTRRIISNRRRKDQQGTKDRISKKLALSVIKELKSPSFKR